MSLERQAADLSQIDMNFAINCRCMVPNVGLLKLLQDARHTDITFLICGHTFPAHKVVLASQSDYFDRMLYGSMLEASSREVTLEDTHPGAFQALLHYMYSGTVEELDLQSGLELLGLADRYNLPNLKSPLQEAFCGVVNLSNVLQFFFYSELYNAHRLHSLCAEFIDSSAEGILRSNTILNLPKENFKALISRDTFTASEIEIFHAVKRWREYHKVDTEDMTDLLQCVRLSEITSDDLVQTVESSGLYSKRSIYDAIQTQKSEALNKGSPRGKRGLNLFEDSTTFLDDIGNFEIVDISEKEHNLDHSPPRPCDFTFKLIYRASTEPSYITFRFDNLYLINELKLEGGLLATHRRENEMEKPFCYRVEVSRDEVEWVQVVDHNKCKCYYTQELFFPKQAVRFVRMFQTRGHEDCKFKFLSCSYVDRDPPFHFNNGILAPCRPMTPAMMRHVVVQDTDIKCFMTFHQPYSISLLRFKLKGLEGSKGYVDIHVAVWNNRRSYQKVACLGYHDFWYELHMTFPEKPVSLIKVTILALAKNDKQYPLDTVKSTDITIEDVVISQAGSKEEIKT